MTKKTYILTLLTKLSGQWAYADGLKALVEQTDVQDSVINGIYDILAQTISEIVDDSKRESLMKWLHALQNIQELEQNHIESEQELDGILNQI